MKLRTPLESPIFPPRTARVFGLVLVLGGIVAITTLLFLPHLQLRYMLVWNMFLGSLPLVFALPLVWRLRQGKIGILSPLLGLFWLVFLPNTPYLLTDLIHLTRYPYYQRGVGFLAIPASWFGLLHLCAGVVAGSLAGIFSIYLLHRFCAERWGEGWGWGFVGLTCALCGIGMHLGRFRRFNTWDLATRPLSIFQHLWDIMSVDTVLLFLIFALMGLLMYTTFYLLFHTK